MQFFASIQTIEKFFMNILVTDKADNGAEVPMVLSLQC